ncbi:hypothetical protein [Pseudorhodoferax sp.]|uniref:hypothetical protein n=1 Tax=Pseudorhodoferax sp. TaxID=1993553 RepID=UPI002DD64726|nr:hypothetical protein [Pseudorhodoferax sp.]
MSSTSGDSSVLLWVASACIAFLGARAFVEYLRRLNYDGPVRLWRELLLGAGALAAGIWASLVIDVSAKGLVFEVGFHPAKIFGSLLLACVAMAAVVGWATFRANWLVQLAAALLAGLVGLIVQVAVLWSIGAEPGLTWRSEPLMFSLLLLFSGLALGGRMVVGARRGSSADRGSRRLMAALVLAACVVASQELVLTASGLDRQVVSAHARFLPEVAISLVAGAVVPIVLVLLLVDQRTQQRARAADRVRRRRRNPGADTGTGESVFADPSSHDTR